MIPREEREFIIASANKYHVSSVILFGSSIREGEEYHDIDIGVNGIAPELFFKFYAELYRFLSKPVDLVDLSKKTAFTAFVEQHGVRIYG